MPPISPSYPKYRSRCGTFNSGTNSVYLRGPYRFVDREYFIVTYETDYDRIKAVVPEPLEPVSNQVLCTYPQLRPLFQLLTFN